MDSEKVRADQTAEIARLAGRMLAADREALLRFCRVRVEKYGEGVAGAIKRPDANAGV